MFQVKTWDVAIVGGGVIGLALARELRKHDVSVIVVERGEPGREATHAAAGMLAFCSPETDAGVRDLCLASARIYPEFVREVEAESGQRVDFRREGTIEFLGAGDHVSPCSGRELSPDDVRRLEPDLALDSPAVFFEEQSVDNRALGQALFAACKARGVDLASGAAVTEIDVREGRAAGVVTTRTRYAAGKVVNCAGAWSGAISPVPLPARPVKGQMVSVAISHRRVLQHVVRTPEVYLVPRSDGRILIGATVENAGYDKHVEPAVIQRFHQAAANLVPAIGEARILEAWAGLRPAVPDNLPVLGATSLPGYYVATGHYRNGILLSAITAEVMSAVVRGEKPGFDIKAFGIQRFGT